MLKIEDTVTKAVTKAFQSIGNVAATVTSSIETIGTTFRRTIEKIKIVVPNLEKVTKELIAQDELNDKWFDRQKEIKKFYDDILDTQQQITETLTDRSKLPLQMVEGVKTEVPVMPVTGTEQFNANVVQTGASISALIPAIDGVAIAFDMLSSYTIKNLNAGLATTKLRIDDLQVGAENLRAAVGGIPDVAVNIKSIDTAELDAVYPQLSGLKDLLDQMWIGIKTQTDQVTGLFDAHIAATRAMVGETGKVEQAIIAKNLAHDVQQHKLDDANKAIAAMAERVKKVNKNVLDGAEGWDAIKTALKGASGAVPGTVERGRAFSYD